MAREKGLYRRKDSPYWWINIVLADGRRVCQSTRLEVLEDAEEFLIRLKAEAYEAAPDRSCGRTKVAGSGASISGRQCRQAEPSG